MLVTAVEKVVEFVWYFVVEGNITSPGHKAYPRKRVHYSIRRYLGVTKRASRRMLWRMLLVVGKRQ